MTYADLMRKIVKLPGWIWEWKFGDRVWQSSSEWIVLEVETTGPRVTIVRNGTIFATTIKILLIPLPTVEQWMEKMRAIGYEVNIGDCEYNNTKFASCQNETMVKTCLGESDVEALAILYASVVLGLKWDRKEFV